MPIWSSGQSIAGRYRLEQPLGSGATAEAWSASDTVTASHVVVKLPRLESADAPSQAAMRATAAAFRREYDASRSLEHPDVPRALAHGRDGGQPFLVTTRVEGRSLTGRRGQPFAALAPLLASLARTLAYVHERGWVHRDLKPDNVLVSGERRVLLTDFGLAARVGERQGANGGSPFTRSPQQAAGMPAAIADDVYSFGALLYELLTGAPPHFPDRAAADSADRVAPRMRPAHPVPERMEQLTMRLLASDPAARPASMQAVAAELEVAMNVTQRPARTARPRWWAWAAGGGFLLAAFVVFFVLPREAQAPRSSAPLVATPLPASAPGGAADPAAAEARAAALRAQARYTERIAALDQRHAAVWSGPELAQARAAALAGDEQIRGEQFPEALVSYTAALDHAAAVEAAAPQALRKALDDGGAALAAAKVAEATQAYQRALAIDPANAAAEHGLRRAATIERVQSLVIAARRAADAGDWPAAAGSYRHALELDGEATEARAGLAEAERQVSEAGYQTAMAAALSALNARRFAAARAAIGEARALRPSAPEPRDLAARVDGAIAGTRIEDLRSEGAAHERNERWNDALTVYDSILARNPTLLFAREGRDRVAPRAELDARFREFIARPERLGDPQVRDAARRTVTQARQLGAAGPVLSSQIARVEGLLATAETPVRVALESDAATQVVIYHVGALGTFTRRELALPPGTYTVVGTRSGFRDVRQELKVRPGEVPAALIVRCEDPI